ncbi:DUF4145 domain-containing protein [Mesorhizobium sp. KR9-304]|uniref:DUF4145 domain-containing protein n=1 Tax=Mesorhizobium sp. KR9-304 TaxID=3156614 RepID=UPI0032B43C0C
MAKNRPLWVQYFDPDAIPDLPCPECRRGNLMLDKKNLLIKTPDHPDHIRNHPDWEPDWDNGIFTCVLVCGSKKCGSSVTMSGNYVWVPGYIAELDTDGFMPFLEPKTMYPGSPLIEIPKQTPASVADAIKQSFVAYWGDRGAAANRLRISVERIMDEESIPAKGTLFDRIELFGKKHTAEKDTLDALRKVGNLGSHDGEVSREALLDAYEAYQYWLSNFYEAYPKHIAGIVKKLNSTKGKYAY